MFHAVSPFFVTCNNAFPVFSLYIAPLDLTADSERSCFYHLLFVDFAVTCRFVCLICRPICFLRAINNCAEIKFSFSHSLTRFGKWKEKKQSYLWSKGETIKR